MDSFWTLFISITGSVTALASVIVVYVKSRGENKVGATNAKTALDARIDERVSEQLKEAWAQIDKQGEDITALQARESHRTVAITRILKAIAKQWPGETGPDLDPADIAEIEETIPADWIRRPSRKVKDHSDTTQEHNG